MTQITALSIGSYSTGTKAIPISTHPIPIPPHFCYFCPRIQQTNNFRYIYPFAGKFCTVAFALVDGWLTYAKFGKAKL